MYPRNFDTRAKTRVITGNAMYSVVCRRCRTVIPEDCYRIACPCCTGVLEFDYSVAGAGGNCPADSMWRYRARLPVREQAPVVSLHEGMTPLEKARNLSDGVEIYFKNETMNPTGSHKDRAISIAMSKAVEYGFDTVMLYSDGSTALSSAAYAARAGLRNITLVPQGMPDDRLAPLLIYNSVILEYQGCAAEALDWVHESCERFQIFETSTYRKANPYQAEGPKTIAYEIAEQLGDAPDWVVVPVGGGGTFAGIWRGFVELRTQDVISKLPRMAGVLPTGYTVLETALREKVDSESGLRALTLSRPPVTIQTKIAMAFPPDGLEALEAVRDSGGLFLFASDEEVLAAQMTLGACEGIYAEPSSAAALCGVEQLRARELTAKGEKAVALITGSGFRENMQTFSSLRVPRTAVDSKSGETVLEELLRSEVRR